ncbi:MAG: aldo/keto reductase [Treponemataceae bacterium]|nr:aldo/keto reductase [Treponemataceae bacterium]
MEYVGLGKTDLLVSRTALEVRALKDESDTEKAITLIRAAYEGGINFFDTCRSYGDAEEKLGYAFYGMRKDVRIASRTQGTSAMEVHRDLAASLEAVKTDYFDIYLLEGTDFVPGPGSADGMYDALSIAKADGIVHHMGFSTHSLELAKEAVESNLYEVLRFPFHMLCREEVLELVSLCEKNDMGIIASEPLADGIITSVPLAFGFLRQYESVAPVWNIATDENLQQVLYFESHPPVIDQQFRDEIAAERSRITL